MPVAHAVAFGGMLVPVVRACSSYWREVSACSACSSY